MGADYAMQIVSGLRTSGVGSYKPGIDGLRALAILSVVLFHSNAQLLPGGFLGVDIFFVISGYLITQTHPDDILANRFTLTGFYMRRVRRIFPALLATIFLSFLAFSIVASPSDLAKFAD